jgi:hypothetical protein
MTHRRTRAGAFFMTGAFSREVYTGSRKENASKQKLEPGSDSIRTGL